MSIQKQPEPREVDLDATDELPMPDFATGQHAHLRTDTFVAPAVATGTAAPVVPAGVADLADSLRDVERRLQRKTERVTRLEAELKAAEEQLAGLQQEHTAAQTALGELREQLQQQRAAYAEVQSALNRRADDRAQLHDDLQQWRRRCERQLEAISSWQGFLGVREAMLGEHAERLDELTAQLAARDATIAALRLQTAAPPPAVAGDQAADDEPARQIARLQSELAAAQAQAGQLQERLQQLESEARASATLLGDAQQKLERTSDIDLRTPPAEAPPATMVRALIRQEGGANIVYPLGRRTTVGRTAENDIQVDTTYVSRHHAVLLSQADHCLIEDLNSTNGVMVNGRRVGRQVLHDGDLVTVGRTEFRYQQRS